MYVWYSPLDIHALNMTFCYFFTEYMYLHIIQKNKSSF